MKYAVKNVQKNFKLNYCKRKKAHLNLYFLFATFSISFIKIQLKAVLFNYSRKTLKNAIIVFKINSKYIKTQN